MELPVSPGSLISQSLEVTVVSSLESLAQTAAAAEENPSKQQRYKASSGRVLRARQKAVCCSVGNLGALLS